MIIIGYQGIGKSTLAKKHKNFIDLESGCFWVDGVRPQDWYKYYCQIAEHLSQQGYVVFTSSHKEVREELKKSKELVVCCIPSLKLKDAWIEKLKKRYDESGLEKDYKAWKNAEACYEENIKDIIDDGFYTYIIKDMNYNLREVIH
jgi:nucleoside-triphosphatase THEP1